MYSDLTTEEKIAKIKIRLQETHPFWAYLILKMDISEDKEKKLPEWGGMGVNARGKMLYNKKFVDSLTEKQLEFCLAHEVSHIIYLHLIRVDKRDSVQWNIATDIAVNYILIRNLFVPPPDAVIPRHDGTIKLFDNTISGLDNKTAEHIYDELSNNKKLMDAITNMKSSYEILIGDGNTGKGFDAHMQDDLTQDEKDAIKEKWKDSIVEAATHAKQRGLNPAGMESLIGKILNPKLNWKQIVKRYIVSYLPYDSSFSKPNKKFNHIILPGTIKENVEMVVALDTSGSISNRDLGQFLGECMSIAMAHRNLKMTLLQCDADIQEVIEFNSHNAKKISNIKAKGRGGTSHIPVVDWVLENAPHCRLLITLTDGYSDIESCYPRLKCDKIIILNRDYNGLEKYGKVVKIEH